MGMNGIDAGQIAAMLTQIRAAANMTQPPQALSGVSATAAGASASAPVASGPGFAEVLKNSLDQVNQVQQQADSLGERFAAGDDSVSLSQTMIAMQKANISFQEAVQVRDRLVSAYTTIMNMQV